MTPGEAGLIVCTPLRVEHWAARRGLPAGAHVVRTGMGPARSREAVRRVVGTGPVAVAGVAGGLSVEVRAGDVVVASAVATPDGGPRACTAAEFLADLLRGRGLTVHVGSVVSTPDIARGAARDVLATKYGAIAADMESGYLADAFAATRAIAVVRVVVDTTDQPLMSPGIVMRGIRGLANLRRAVAVLPEWARGVETHTPTKGMG